MLPQKGEKDAIDLKGGLLLKRKDFLGVDEKAGAHPNRTYYFKKNADDLNKVIQTSSSALQHDPYDKKSLLLRGSTFLKMERYQEAVGDFTKLLQVDSSSMETYYKRGMAFAKLDDQEAAIADFTKVLDNDPDHVNAAFARAACFNTIGQFSKAIEDYNVALLKDQVVSSSSRPGTPNPKIASHHKDSSGRRPRSLSSSSINDYCQEESSNALSARRLTPTRDMQKSPAADLRRYSPPSRAASGLLDTTSPVLNRSRNESEDDVSTVISGITFMSNANTLKGGTDSPADSSPHFAHLPLSSDEYHQKGYELRRKGKFTQAIEEYSKALQKDPRHFKALFNRAFAFDKVGEHKAAVRDYSRALDVDPANSYAYYNRGISHDRQKNYFEASVDFKQAIKLSPQNLDFQHNLALCLRKMGHMQESYDAYSKCLQLDPLHVKARHGRAMCSEKLKLFEQALKDYDFILLNHPQNILCMVSRAHLLHRMSYQAEHNTEERQPKYLEEAYASFSQSLGILCPNEQELVDSVRRISNPSSASSTSSQISGNLNRCTEAISLLYGRAKISEDRGENASAVRDLSSAIRLATALLELQDNSFAIPRASGSGIAVDLLDSPCLSLYLLYYNRALAWKASDQYDKAMSDLTTTLKLLNDECHSLKQLRDVESRNRLQYLTNALNNAYNHRGFCHRKVDDYDGAIRDYSKALLAVPANARALNNRAYCYAKKGMYAEAVTDYSCVIEIDPLNSHAYHNRGISLEKLGRAAEAADDFAKVLELDSAAHSLGGSEQIDISSSFRERYAADGPESQNQQPEICSPTMVASEPRRLSASSGPAAPKIRKPRRPPPSRPTHPSSVPTRDRSLSADSPGLSNNHDESLLTPASEQRPSFSSSISSRRNISPSRRQGVNPLANAAPPPPQLALSPRRRDRPDRAKSVGTMHKRQSPLPVAERSDRQGEHKHSSSRQFEPIRLTPRGNKSNNTNHIRIGSSMGPSPPGETFVRNSYNSRSFQEISN